MRRTPLGPSLVLAVAVVLCGFELGLGCSHDPKPVVVDPPGPTPLPPASGTPIGYLVDDATELKLTDDQLARLKAIDGDLAAKLGTLDAQLHSPGAAAGSGQPRGRRRGGGGGGGGFRGGGGRRGGMRGGGAGSGSGSGSAAPRSTAASADTVNRVTEQRAADVRDAIDRALAALDVVQRVMAKRVLTDHGVDLDAGRPAGTSKAGSGEPTGEPTGEPDDTEPDEPDGAGSGSN